MNAEINHFLEESEDVYNMNNMESLPYDGGILLCPDNKYRWIYRFPMLRNPSILLTILSIFGWILAGLVCFSFLLAVFDGDIGSWIENFLLHKGFRILVCVLIALSLIAYLILAILYGFQYTVLFEMDEKKILHIHVDRQFQKAKAIGALLSAAGSMAGNPTLTGMGIHVRSKNIQESEFRSVRSIIGRRNRNTIYLCQMLMRNQIYVRNEDFDFVWRYICERCPNAKVSGG